jgi:allantoicase
VLDCEKHTPEEPYAIVQVPPYTASTGPKATSKGKPLANGHSTYEKLNGLVSSLPLVNGLNGHGPSGPIVPVPISREGFAPFGQVLHAYPDPETRYEGMDIQVAPDGMATKYARLAEIKSTYPEELGAVTGISVFRATPKVGLERGKVFDIRYMERHPYTSQAFVPMGKAEVSAAVE